MLLLGIIAAAVVYWLGTRTSDFSNDPAMTGYYKAETRQTEMLYGKEGVVIKDLYNDLKQPRAEAILILIGSVVVSGVCFLLAKFPAIEDEHDDSN